MQMLSKIRARTTIQSSIAVALIALAAAALLWSLLTTRSPRVTSATFTRDIPVFLLCFATGSFVYWCKKAKMNHPVRGFYVAMLAVLLFLGGIFTGAALVLHAQERRAQISPPANPQPEQRQLDGGRVAHHRRGSRQARPSDAFGDTIILLARNARDVRAQA